MPKHRKKELIQCQYFNWKLGIRNGVYFADGRSGNRQDLGRHSLGTQSIIDARDGLKALDVAKAVELGLISKEARQPHGHQNSLTIQDGWELYRNHTSRSPVAGGARLSTQKRYRAVFDKFILFSNSKGVGLWTQVDKALLERYLTWLASKQYAYRTQTLELTTIIQCAKWLADEHHLPAGYRLALRLKKAQGTDTYCWKTEEVTAIVKHCQSQKHLHWLGEVIAALAMTGLRISELASLRWTDVNFDTKMITLTDETARTTSSTARTTKSGRDRSCPLHADLEQILRNITRHRDGLVFHGPQGGRLKPDTVRNILKREVLTPLESSFPSTAGIIGFKNGGLHSFRHYFCSVCANSGTPELIVMNWLGHANSNMVRHYYHLNNREAQRQMSKLHFVDPAGSTVLLATPRLEEAVANESTVLKSSLAQ